LALRLSRDGDRAELVAGRGRAALDGARWLTGKVEFVEADATRLPLPGRSFSACVSQEAFVHIADKGHLLGECHRVLRPGGTLVFTDWVAGEELEGSERDRLRADLAAFGLSTVDAYREQLAACGFRQIDAEDLSGVGSDPARPARDVPLPS
jgi:sarcosine/dimethylglycine N-methyltransferase